MPSSSLRGILCMLCAVSCFAVMDMAMKQLVVSYFALQVSFIRGLASLPFVIGATLAGSQWRSLFAVNWTVHIVRGLLGVVILVAFIFALSKLSLSDAYSIRLCAPLLITALSVAFLKEKVSWQQGIAVAAGLTGVLIILRPTGSSMLTLGGLAALMAALGYAISAILIRIASRTDSAAATVLWTMVISTLGAGVLAAFSWVPLHFHHWPWILAIGVAGALGQYLLTAAFRLAPAGIIAPFEYTALLWGMIFDWFLWMTAPSLRMLIGASIVVASGLYVIHHTRTKARE
jgi:drug/metabolite transporter (DMT)-like permease